MASKKVWFFKDGSVEIGPTIASVSGSSSLESQMSASGTWTSRIKDVDLGFGDRDIEPINVMGVQQLKQENRPEIAIITFNTVYYPQGSSTGIAFFDYLLGQGTAVGATGYVRYQGGEKTSNDRPDMSVLLKLSRPGGAVSDTVTVLLNAANATRGAVTGDSEGHLTQEWIVKCLSGDIYIDTGVTANPAT